MATTREFIATLLNEHPQLREMGLPRDAVHQADSIDSPDTFPFLVLRWLDEEETGSVSTRRPLDLWVYDTKGDYTNAERLGRKACEILKELDVTRTEGGGHILEIRGGTRGRDLYDQDYDAATIPYRLTVIASGV